MTWDDETDAILDGDLTAALGYRTPLGGAIVQAVAPVGLRDRAAGWVGFTTSLGFSKKLVAFARDPRVSLAFHAREHGGTRSDRYVLVQGRAVVIDQPSPAERERMATQAAARLGPPLRGWFWDRWLREYYQVRVPVHVMVERMVIWPDLRCAGAPHTHGQPLPEGPVAAQSPPRRGRGARVDIGRAGRRLQGCAHVLLGYPGADGWPMVVPLDVTRIGLEGLELSAATPLPLGGRRGGLLGHSYRPQLVGLEARQYTGWLEVSEDGRGIYAPHTEKGYRAPANKTLLNLINGALAKRGVRQASSRGA